jgi:hypothetical protein
MTIKNGKRILALDASTTCVGWCVAQGTEYVDSGVFVPDKNAEWWDRVTAFQNWLGNVLLGDQDIELVVYEQATGNRKNMHTNRLLGACEYAARCEVRDTSGQRRFETVTASQVKAVGVNKDNLFSARAYKGAPLDENHAGDEADSFGIVFAYHKKIGYQAN